jgi:hypothetical protein
MRLVIGFSPFRHRVFFCEQLRAGDVDFWGSLDADSYNMASRLEDNDFDVRADLEGLARFAG